MCGGRGTTGPRMAAATAAARAARGPPPPPGAPPALGASCAPRAAKLHPERSYYYRAGDAGALIDACNRKLSAQPGNVRALYTRALCLMKQRVYANAIEDWSVVRRGGAAQARATGWRVLLAPGSGVAARSPRSSSWTHPAPHPAPQLLTSASLSSSFSSSLGPYEAAAAHWHRGVAYDRLGYTNEAIAGACVRACVDRVCV